MANSRRCLPGFIVVGLLALVLTSVQGVVPVGGDAPRDCAEAQSTVRVGVVIDFGVLVGEQGAPGVKRSCGAVDDGMNGFEILEATGHTYTVDGSALLCSIDGYPNNGECGERTATGYRYWAYFHGSSAGWVYSGQGPGAFEAHAPEVEGWHFVEGKGNKTDPVPNGPSDPAQICPPAPTSTTKAPAVTTPTPPAGTPSTTPSRPTGPNGGPPSSSPTVGGADPRTTTPSGDPVAADPAPGSDPTGDGAGDPSDGAGDAGAGRGSTSTAATSNGGTDDHGATDVALASVPSSSTGSGVPLGAIAVVILIVGFGGAAALRFRSTSEIPR